MISCSFQFGITLIAFMSHYFCSCWMKQPLEQVFITYSGSRLTEVTFLNAPQPQTLQKPGFKYLLSSSSSKLRALWDLEYMGTYPCFFLRVYCFAFIPCILPILHSRDCEE